ncbi:MAG: type II secretion system F family protein [Chthonomonadaceae bacterium]|nr:type II secretion system F family protein [Chthonomonadaceae bacterium]
MPDFTYEALDKAGSRSSGTITANDKTDAALKVRALGVFPTQIASGSKLSSSSSNGQSKPVGEKSGGVKFGGKKISRIQILLFTREMSDLLDAGLPMDRAFSVLLDQAESEGLRTMLTTMQGDIRAGQPLSSALVKYPKEFPPLYSNMVRAGEVSGQLSEVMTRLADFLEKEQTRRSLIVAALTYPAVLLGVALLAILFLLVFAIPSLTGVFKGLGASLPLPTQILIGVSGVVAKFWWLMLLTIAGSVYGFRKWTATEKGKMSYDGFRLKAPLFGKLVQKIVSARLVRTLGTLLGGGVPILEAMDISASALGNVVAARAVIEARGGVRQGETLHEAMERGGTFLPVVRHMTAVGEETGRLPAMLLRTADTLDFEVDNAMRKLTSLIEPLVVLFMGGFVGFVVMSILLPIFQINTLVK